MPRKLSNRYKVEAKGQQYVIIDTKASSKRYREIETNKSRRVLLEKCREFNRYVAEWDYE
jgi:hypothetical protein|tara:strand:+ start:522 stop:701 length:180 start_codon:yes stop_codon:yes gene_type:complete